jgi:hypothetical protein
LDWDRIEEFLLAGIKNQCPLANIKVVADRFDVTAGEMSLISL